MMKLKRKPTILIFILVLILLIIPIEPIFVDGNLFKESFVVNNENGHKKQEMLWNKTYGGDDTDRAYALVQTADGGFALAGWTDSFGAGDPNMCLVETDVNGTVLWDQMYEGTKYEYAQVLIVTVDGGFAFAGQQRDSSFDLIDILLVKTNPNGEQEWNRTYGGVYSDYVSAIIQTADGGFVLAGSTEAPSDDSDMWLTDSDMWLIKTDSSGIEQWTATYGEKGALYNDESAHALVQTADGGFALAGSKSKYERYDFDTDMWLVKTDADGEQQWNRTFGGKELDGAGFLVQTADGGFALAGHTSSYGSGFRDMWLVKTDANGKHQWNRTYSEKEFTDYGYYYGTGGAEAFVYTKDGGFALVTTLSYETGYSDVWLVKTDENGVLQWTETFGGENGDSINAIIQTADGGFALAGWTNSFGIDIYDTDMWLVKTMTSPNNKETSSLGFIFTLVGIGVIVDWNKRSKRD